MTVHIGFLPYLLHRAPRQPTGGESDPQLVHVDPSVLVQIQLLEELGPEPLAFGVDPAVHASRPRPARAASALPHYDFHARSPTERHRLRTGGRRVLCASKKGAVGEINPLASRPTSSRFADGVKQLFYTRTRKLSQSWIQYFQDTHALAVSYPQALRHFKASWKHQAVLMRQNMMNACVTRVEDCSDLTAAVATHRYNSGFRLHPQEGLPSANICVI